MVFMLRKTLPLLVVLVIAGGALSFWRFSDGGLFGSSSGGECLDSYAADMANYLLQPQPNPQEIATLHNRITTNDALGSGVNCAFISVIYNLSIRDTAAAREAFEMLPSDDDIQLNGELAQFVYTRPSLDREITLLEGAEAPIEALLDSSPLEPGE